MFMAFIADITLAAISYFESDKLRACTAETLPRIVLELNKYKIERNEDGTWRPGYAMNKDQKQSLQNWEYPKMMRMMLSRRLELKKEQQIEEKL